MCNIDGHPTWTASMSGIMHGLGRRVFPFEFSTYLIKHGNILNKYLFLQIGTKKYSSDYLIYLDVIKCGHQRGPSARWIDFLWKVDHHQILVEIGKQAIVHLWHLLGKAYVQHKTAVDWLIIWHKIESAIILDCKPRNFFRQDLCLIYSSSRACD